MRAGPMLLEFLGHAFGDQMHWQAGSIGGDDRARLAKLRHTREQVSLDLQIFRHDFDNPVSFRAARKIIFKISDGNFLRKSCA